MRIRPLAFCLGVSVTPGFALTAHADVTVLQDPGGLGNSGPFFGAINDAGQSVGQSFTFGQFGSDAVRWSPTGQATVLQAVGSQGAGFANFINNSGWIAGGSDFVDATGLHFDAVLWSPSGKATVLQDAGGQGFSFSEALNNAGQVAGFSNTASGQDAVLWSRSGQATVLQDVGGKGDSLALALNNSGRSVGFSDTATGSDAVLWSPSGKATDLGAVLGPAWSDTQAVGINNAGDIVGTGAFNGGTFGFLLTPHGANAWALASVSVASFSDPAVPEPSTWAMMLIGLAALGFVGWRTRASKHASSERTIHA
jgi:hypothetical protein